MGTTATKPEKKVIMLGLGGSGKTTLLYHMRLGKYIDTVPTSEFNVETIQHEDILLEIWELTDKLETRSLLKVHFPNTCALIYVVDSHDTENIDDAIEQLKRLRSNQLLTDVPVLVYANKNDLPNPMSMTEITQHLELAEIDGKKWHIQSVCGLTGEGVNEGLDWLFGRLDASHIYFSGLNKDIYPGV